MPERPRPGREGEPRALDDAELDVVTGAGSAREALVFTSVSNVLKLRHDTAKNSISNIR
jgi:hypothetical protein